MATRFRKLRTRKMKHRKALKTRKQRGGETFGKNPLTRFIADVRHGLRKIKEGKQGNEMIKEEEDKLNKIANITEKLENDKKELETLKRIPKSNHRQQVLRDHIQGLLRQLKNISPDHSALKNLINKA